MNRSYSKIRHIQESNMKLENRRLMEQVSAGKTATATAMEPSKESLKKQIKDAYAVLSQETVKNRSKNHPNPMLPSELYKIVEIGYPGGVYGEFGGATLAPYKTMEIEIFCNAPRSSNQPPKLKNFANHTGNYFPSYFGAPGPTEKLNPAGQSFASSVCRAIWDENEKLKNQQQ